MSRLSLSLGVSLAGQAVVSHTVAAGPSYGPELWPQPSFDASTGLTLTNSSISGGQLLFVGSGSTAIAQITVPPLTLTNGMSFHYEIDIASGDFEDWGATLRLLIGGTAKTITTANGAQVLSGTATTTAASQIIRLDNPFGEVTAAINSFSLKQIL